MSPASRQLRLLLWKDYLVRKRKIITLMGIVWATAVVICLYVVRANVDNLDFPSCQFTARALPSAGMINFIQSFVCSVNNNCNPLDDYEEIPTYENAKLTQLQRKFSPLIYNETILDVATTVPSALKLLSKLAEVVDDPTFIQISKNGIRVQDLFSDPSRVKRYLSRQLELSPDVANDVMTAELNMQGIFSGNNKKCASRVSNLVKMDSERNLQLLTNKLCSLDDKGVQKMIMDLMLEINFRKYIRMIGNMYHKLSGDDRLKDLGDTMSAVLRMTRMQSFLPAEVGAIVQGTEADFSYFDSELVTKLMNLLKPTFGNTESYQQIRDFSDTIVSGLKFLSKLIVENSEINEVSENREMEALAYGEESKENVKDLSKAVGRTKELSDTSIDVFNLLAQVTKLINKNLNSNTQHELLLYSTLLAKLIEGATHVININMHIEERAYEVSLRNPDGVKVLTGLPSHIVAKGFEGLVDAERTQIVTAKINKPGQVFCSVNTLQGFFKISKEEANSIKKIVCTDAWNNYVADLIKTFGVFDVKDKINEMASLLIQETLGKSTADQLYTIEYDFQVLKNFTHTLSKATTEKIPQMNWNKLLNMTEDSQFMKTVRSKEFLGKQILVVVHGALAKEVVGQNPILSYKISPFLIDTTTLVTALNEQLDAAPDNLVRAIRKIYPTILETILRTANNEEKTYKALSTHSEDIMCEGVDNAALYLNFPKNIDAEVLISSLCDLSRIIEGGLKSGSIFGKAIDSIRKSNRSAFESVKWTDLITGIKRLYVTLQRDYPYLFEYGSYGMNEEQLMEVDRLVKDATKLWFDKKNIGRSVLLGINAGLRMLDLVDREIWNVTSQGWLQMKYSLYAFSGPIEVFDDFVKVVAAISRNESFSSNLPPVTVSALGVILPNLPQLIIDEVDIVTADETQIEPIIELLNANPPWPCSTTSLSELLQLPESSAKAVRSLEILMCGGEDIHGEWRKYLAERNVTLFDLKKFNTTLYPPHTFLKFASTFNRLIEDGVLVREILQDVINDTSDGVTWVYAWKHVVELFNRADKDTILKNFFSKVDAVLPAINATQISGSLFSLWQNYITCGIRSPQSNDTCRVTARSAWKYTLKFFSVMFKEAAGDLLTFFKEINDPETSLLQLMGFTKRTPLYDMYANFGHYMGVLLNSYWDHGFMSQIRKASLSQFWDCEGILLSLVPPPGSIVTKKTIKRVQPFVCPSFLYWLSLPKGDNTLLDVVAKPQYYFYTLDVNDLTSTYEAAYEKMNELAIFLIDLANKNQTLITDEDIKLNSLQYKLEKLVNNVLNYKLNSSDPSYKTFYDINRKQFATTVYLTRIVSIINKIITSISNSNVTDDLKDDLKSIDIQFRRRPDYFIGVHFDLITDVIWSNDKQYTLLEAMDKMCDVQSNDTNKAILIDSLNMKVKNIICSKRYSEIYRDVVNDIGNDFKTARYSLMNLIKILQNGSEDGVKDVFDFIHEREQLINSIKKSVTYGYELGIPVYLKYLQSNLQHYTVILTFLSGGDWWIELRGIYNGPHSYKFFDSLEKSFEIIGDVLGHLDKIHFVRFLHDLNVNKSDGFCQPNITLSDYVPDATGVLSDLKRSLCEIEPSDLFEEIPPLLFASQGYSSDLKLSKEVNYTSLNFDLTKTEALLDVNQELQSPQRPYWVTEDKLNSLRKAAFGLLSKETLTSIAFGLLSNIVDAGTLYLNDSSCSMCSQLTSWIKQLNLQVFKKQEYDSLLCHIDDMSLEDVYLTLKNDFHWDMAFQELILTRNYTKYELNKSLNEFLELVKLHLLEDMLAETTKLTDCLARNVTRNAFGNATLFVTILSKTARLLRAQTPHLHEVDGFTSLPYFTQLETQVAQNLDVYMSPKKYIRRGFVEQLEQATDDRIADDIVNSDYNLRLLIDNKATIENVVNLRQNSWEHICNMHDCSKIYDVIKNNINHTLVKSELPTLQTEKFWQFTFISDILKHIEDLLHHLSRTLAIVSKVDVQGVIEGRPASMIDFLVIVLADEVTNDILFSLEGLVSDLHPLLEDSPLEYDMKALAAGLKVIQEFKNYLVEKEDLRVDVSMYFPHPDSVELGLERLGINNTNFWSIAAPRIQTGYIQLKPILTPESDYHISNFVCQMDSMSQVIYPYNLDVVTAEDVYGATMEQFCGLDDDRVMKIIPVLLGNLNYSAVIERVTNILLPQLYASANLTESEGASIIERYPQMAALMPVIQENVGDLSDTIAREPLVQSLRSADSLGGLLESYSFQKSVGDMLCGAPLPSQDSRFFKAIAQSKDFSTELDQAQLEVLPTEFCRDMYKQIMSIKGGKILWSFIKPLIMGKILYTPHNPTVHRIVQKANATFAHMIKLVTIIHSFAGSFHHLEELSTHRQGVAALNNIITSPSFADLKVMLVGNASVPDVDVDQVFNEFGDLQGIRSLMKRGSDILRCINLDRFTAVSDEYSLAHEAIKLSRVNEFSAGLVFLNADEIGENPRKIEYKIRMDIDNAPTTARMKNYLWVPGPESSFVENMRYFRGFVQLQDMIDKAIIDLSRSNTSRVKRETRMEDKWAVYTQQQPYPCYRKDFYQTSVYESQALIVAFFFSLLFTVASTVRFIVSDKESGNTMLMSVMGVNLTYHTLSWFVASLVEMLITITCMTIVLKIGHILPHTDTSLIFVLLFIFGLAVLSFCYMMSKLFSSASFAAVCTAIAYLVSFMPFVIILSLEAVIPATFKLIVCLSMSSAISYTFLYIARFEAVGVGAQWSDIWSTPTDEDLSLGVGAIMTLFDAALYFAIGCLLDRFFGPKTLQSSVTNCTTSTEKSGVSIVNVSKIYHEGTRRAKVALDNVSIELQKGQVTALLGHNGAGKTTLINILIGMLKPSKGHITIRSEPSSRTKVGVCPQQDVLFEQLSASEHVTLYAQLKSGLPLEQLQDEVQSILQVLSLGAVAHEPVFRLSGGTRRRLCVALAFVARPLLVSLDEPTAGVDPAARRDIWSMIVKLRQGRTILLTTHHLDEAELLSDQIVIMHRGQVHTTGSPIEIKRSLGNGYKLSVLYPKLSSNWSDEDERISMEERAKQLVSLVMSRIKNSKLVEASETAIEMQLPLFDPDGVHNDFLQLCTSLEGQQSALGFSGYSLECSTLEHVFFNICQQVDCASAPSNGIAIEYNPDTPSKSASTSSIKSDKTPLVPADGPVKGGSWEQFFGLLHARYLHYSRNRWLLFLLIILPSLFVATAMGFSLIRPPPDNEIALRLHPDLYANSTQYIVPHPSVYNTSNTVEPTFAQRVMDMLQYDVAARNWSITDTPECACAETKQICDLNEQHYNRPNMMVLPGAETLNDWLIKSHDAYIEKRYGGYSSSLKNNITHLVVWYNNKGHHAMPAYINAMNNALLKSLSGDREANITVYSHPLKISKEQISKDTVYQHVADAGISALVLVGYSLVSAGAAVYLVHARRRQEKRLQLLCGVTPAMYWTAALTADMIIIVVNIIITAIVFEAFGFPVFVARNNLPAICLLILLYGYACGTFTHVLEKLFTEASMANMLLFCGNAFLGLAGITLLLILDIISESDATDNARWTLHKIFMLSPQFVLADGMLEVAKNTIQAQVLQRFGMDTYKDPLTTSLIVYHYLALILVGTALLLLNLAIEYNLFEGILVRFRSEAISENSTGEMEDLEVAAERRRVHEALARRAEGAVRLPTIGNINAGFVDTEVKNNSIKRVVSPSSDAAQCVDLGKAYPSLGGYKTAVRGLTLGIPPGQCTALLGQNGAGKSTTFAMLTGETRPTTGQIYLNEKPANHLQLCNGLISYCPQSDAIDPLLTVRETLRFYCRLRGITDQIEVIRRTLDMFELTKYADVQNGTLSGGNKRKLCTAIAFMGRTLLVLLDEPTSGMDPLSRACVSRGVRMACACARAVVLSTHALHDARRVAERVALLQDGRLRALAPLHLCLDRFGGGYVVACRCRCAPRDAWRRVKQAAAHAQLKVLHHTIIHFLLPMHATVNSKEVTTKLSDVFRLMADLQSTCDIEDYTVNQSSLDQMFLSFTGRSDEEMEPVDIEPLPTPMPLRRNSCELNSITSL